MAFYRFIINVTQIQIHCKKMGLSIMPSTKVHNLIEFHDKFLISFYRLQERRSLLRNFLSLVKEKCKFHESNF